MIAPLPNGSVLCASSVASIQNYFVGENFFYLTERGDEAAAERGGGGAQRGWCGVLDEGAASPLPTS